METARALLESTTQAMAARGRRLASASGQERRRGGGSDGWLRSRTGGCVCRSVVRPFWLRAARKGAAAKEGRGGDEACGARARG